MSTHEKQCDFSLQIAYLRIYAENIGCRLSYGEAYATSGHIKNSTHYSRLAVDFNLFVEGVYVEDSENHMWKRLHDYWEELGGSKMIPNDANHFSFKHNGIR